MTKTTKTTKTATHNGTCQVCGNVQALPGGVLSKHGYTVEHHFFNGVCPGASALPLEQDRKLADDVAASLRRQAVELRDRADKIETGALLPEFAKSGKRVQNGTTTWGSPKMVDELVAFDSAPVHFQREACSTAFYQAQSRAKFADQVAKDIADRANKINGKQALQPRATEKAKAIEAGDRVTYGGAERTVVRIEGRVCQGCGPYMNGQYLPHAVFARDDGREFSVPVRSVRRIKEAA
jgi:hypothetical protein